MTTTETFVANVRRELTARNWTQTELARRCKWPPSRVAEMLAGNHHPRLDTVETVATAFGITSSVLLTPLPENLAVVS